eukprot:jgi/Mesen1/8441/ME000475S07703
MVATMQLLSCPSSCGLFNSTQMCSRFSKVNASSHRGGLERVRLATDHDLYRGSCQAFGQMPGLQWTRSVRRTSGVRAARQQSEGLRQGDSSVLFVSRAGKVSNQEGARVAERLKALRASEKVETVASPPPPSTPAQQGIAAIPKLWLGAGIAAAIVVAAGIAALLQRRKPAGERSMDALARRGFVAGDRDEPMGVIEGYDDPTRVRSYEIDNTRLAEFEPLPPLSEEKIRRHRELRMAEHGWKKPEATLVEGDAVPPGVDPKAVRYIPRKHPFALAQDEVQEKLTEEVILRRLKQRSGRPEKEKEEIQRRLARWRMEAGGDVAGGGPGRAGLPDESPLGALEERGNSSGDGDAGSVPTARVCSLQALIGGFFAPPFCPWIRFLEHYPRATSEQTPYFAARHDPLTSFPSSKSTGELLSSRSTGDRPRTPPTSSSPDRQPSKPCLYFARGHCKHGDDCKFLHVAPRLKNPPGGAAGENPPPATTPEVLEVEVVDLVSSHNGPVTTSSLPQLYFEKYKKTLRADGYLTGTESRGKTGFSLTKLLKSFRALALIERESDGSQREVRRLSKGSQLAVLLEPGVAAIGANEASPCPFMCAQVSVRIPDDYPRQYGFVTFYDASIAQKVLMDRDRDTPHDIGGTEVRVKEYDSSARPKGEKKAKGDALAPAVAIPGSPPPGLVPARYDDRDGSSMFLALQQGEDRQLYRRQLEDEDAAAHRIHAALAASMQQMSLVAAAPGSGSGSGSGAGSPRLLGGSSVAADLYSAAAGGPQQQQQQDARDVWAASLYPPAQQVAARQQDSRGGGGGGGGGMYAPPSGLLPGGAYLHQHQQDADLELYGPPGVGGFRSHPDEVQARGMYPGSSALEQMYSLTERSGQLGQQQQQELAQVSHMYGAAAAAPPPSGASGKGKAANKSKQLLLQQQQVQHQQQHPMFYPATHVGAAGLSSNLFLHGQQAAAAATQQRQQQQQQHSEQQPHPAFPHSHSLPHARRRSFAASPSPPPSPSATPSPPPLALGAPAPAPCTSIATTTASSRPI